MAGIKIAELSQMFSQAQMPSAGKVQNQEEAAVRFQQMMGQAANAVASGLGGNTVSGLENAYPEQSSSEHYERYQYQDNGIKEQKTEIKTLDDDTAEKLDAYAGEVKEVLQEELGVSEEQIEEAMQMLGMTAVDLLDAKQLSGLIVQLTGCGDMGELLCSGEFLTIMQTAGQLGEDLLQELGVSMEELTQMFEQAKAGLVQEPSDAEISVAEMPSDEIPSGEPLQDGTSVQPEENQEDKTAVARQENTPEMQQTAEDTTGQEDAAGQEENDFLNEWFSDSQQTNTGAANTNTVFGQKLTEVTYVQGANADIQTYTQVDVGNIMKQIVEFSKVTVASMETTMEMQLNPEQLGKIYMTVTSKDGTVSAQIMAQNETVKEVLEAQIAELKQNMNQAGVKVESVEVTVGSHEFERNLEQNAKQQERQAEEHERTAKQTRRIRLDGLGELAGIMSEEETLVAQMMAEQGNTVDFTA